MNVELTHYADYFEYSSNLETGEYVLKVGGESMTIEEFNKLQEDEC